MNILIVPTIREYYKDQFEYNVDLRLINFLKECFKNSIITIYNDSLYNKKFDLTVFSGGNSIKYKNKSDKLRQKIDNKIYLDCISKKTKILGICHGAQFIAEKFNFTFKKSKNHVGNHKVNFYFKNKYFNFKCNSYHNLVMKKKIDDSINCFGLAHDKTIEAYHIKSKKILGIIWHPERYSKYRIFDKKLIRKFYATNSISSW